VHLHNINTHICIHVYGQSKPVITSIYTTDKYNSSPELSYMQLLTEIMYLKSECRFLTSINVVPINVPYITGLLFVFVSLYHNSSAVITDFKNETLKTKILHLFTNTYCEMRGPKSC
jgi:hypothetical protein